MHPFECKVMNAPLFTCTFIYLATPSFSFPLMHGRLFDIIYPTSKYPPSPPTHTFCSPLTATVCGVGGGWWLLWGWGVSVFSSFFFSSQKYFLTSRRLKRATICLHTWPERQTMPGSVGASQTGGHVCRAERSKYSDGAGEQTQAKVFRGGGERRGGRFGCACNDIPHSYFNQP